MSNIELTEKIREYRELKRMAEETLAIADAIADDLKSYMVSEGQDHMVVSEYKLSYVDIVRRDIDKKRLENEYKSIYDSLLRETTYKRFSVA